jgi:hypothetical protein
VPDIGIISDMGNLIAGIAQTPDHYVAKGHTAKIAQVLGPINRGAAVVKRNIPFFLGFEFFFFPG